MATAERAPQPAPTDIPEHQPEEYLRIGEMAIESGRSIASLRRWSDDGKIEHYRTPGGQRLFPRGAFQRMLESQAQNEQ